MRRVTFLEIKKKRIIIKKVPFAKKMVKSNGEAFNLDREPLAC